MVSFVLLLGAFMVLILFTISAIAAVLIFRAAKRGRPVGGGRSHRSRHSDSGPFYSSSHDGGGSSDDHSWGDSGGSSWGDSGGGGGDSGGGGGGGD
ncbi:hypothetical protein [Actinoplanes aureus]|uniref:Uncharacterized protein n=1 Tax=Actinoplanes aureus TaxID=2792083 RepID=A0A931C6P4_9ACTN|nr:hypothetical protein [Actinoplanes aureus]MBG0560463.1 hypothetical protein [Actinoplanes aureus]